MRHKKNTKKLKRTEEERKKLFIQLSSALINESKIVTFTGRAKWFRPKFERLVTLVKNSNGDAKLAYSKVRKFLKEEEARILIEKIAPKMANRTGGYTRLIKLHQDYSQHDKSLVMLVGEDDKPTKKVEKKDTPTRAKKATPKAEAKPVEEAPAAKPAPAKTTKSESKPDDLTKIEGIGPKIATTLNDAGILTFAQLSEAKAEDISKMIEEVRGNHDPKTWPKQSKLAADGEWDKLKTLQDELDGGK